MNKQETVLQYYIQELTALREEGAAFAVRYPKIAARLELDKDECADPHIERLLEAVAFLTGRIRYHIDSEFPIFTTALLDILYPHYLQPVPSLTIAQFAIEPQQGQITEGYLIPRHSSVYTKAVSKDLVCRFRTCYPLVLWPLEISAAQFESKNEYSFLDTRPEVAGVLRLRFTCQTGITLQQLNQLTTLRVHLNQPWLEAGPLYELLFGHLLEINLLSASQHLSLPAQAIRAVGFDEEESVLPYPSYSHPAYSLLQEYFAFPDKFLFFDLTQLHKLFEHDLIQDQQTEFDVLFLFNTHLTLKVDKNAFKLGCTPIINLFSKVSEPIRMDYHRTEYRLVPDVQHERITEIHSVLKVTTSSLEKKDETSVEVQPFFSFRHAAKAKGHRSFWFTRRIPTQRSDLTGTDLLLSFLDLDFIPTVPPHQILFAHLLCTNRELAMQVQPGTELSLEDSAPLKGIFTLKHPTSQLSPPLEGASVWRIISHLSLNHLSLTEKKSNLSALQEILRLYNLAQDKSIEKRILGIRKMHVERKVRRLGEDAWRGFIRGFEIILEVDRDSYKGSSAFLLASILDRFFALYVSVNSFTRLILKEEHSETLWKKWPPRSGRNIQL